MCKHSPPAHLNRCPLCDPDAAYRLVASEYLGEPVIEVTRDGQPWNSPWDTHFRFGRIKTAAILFCRKDIQKFALSKHPGAMLPDPVVRQPDPDLTLQLQTFPAFTNSGGAVVDEPFLRIERLRHGSVTHYIGFGQRKAAALVLLQKDLEAWLRRIRGWYS